MDLTLSLTRLGDTPGAIARSLEDRGFTGRRGDSTRCPLARYLVTEGVDVVGVAPGSVAWAEPGELYSTAVVPQTVTDFLYAFDAGTFPALEDPEAAA